MMTELQDYPADPGTVRSLARRLGLDPDHLDDDLDEIIAAECGRIAADQPRHGHPIHLRRGHQILPGAEEIELLLRARGVLVFDDERAPWRTQRSAAVYEVDLKLLPGAGALCIEKRTLAQVPGDIGWVQCGVPGLDRVVFLGARAQWADLERLLAGARFAAGCSVRTFHGALAVCLAAASFAEGSDLPGTLAGYGGAGQSSFNRFDLARRAWWMQSWQFSRWLLHPGLLRQVEDPAEAVAAALLLRLEVASWQLPRGELRYAGYPQLASVVQHLYRAGPPGLAEVEAALATAERLLEQTATDHVLAPRRRLLEAWLARQAGPWARGRRWPATEHEDELRTLIDVDEELQRQLAHLHDQREEAVIKAWAEVFPDFRAVRTDQARGLLSAALQRRPGVRPRASASLLGRMEAEFRAFRGAGASGSGPQPPATAVSPGPARGA